MAGSPALDRPASPDTGAVVEHVRVRAYEVPTDQPEADGTLEWDATTAIVVELTASGVTGIGWTYGPAAIGRLIADELVPVLEGADAMAIGASWDAMSVRLRNAGRPGISAMAIAACDIAAWDLKARLLGLPLVDLLGRVRDGVDAYGSGGFTNYSEERLAAQLGVWADQGLGAIKIKIGRDRLADPERVRLARRAVGDEVDLLVDANGALDRKGALATAVELAPYGVTWFEEPVSSDDLAGLRLLRDRAPAPVEIAAGEYGYDLPYFRRMLEAQAVDVLQADATRCGGFTGFLGADALCRAHSVPLSAHCAPSLHAHVGCACTSLRHVEYFHDHARLEAMLFDGALRPTRGRLVPDRGAAGLGVAVDEDAAATFEVTGW